MSLSMIALRAATAAFLVTALTGLPDTVFAQTNETVGQLPTLETKQAIETLATQSDLGPIDTRTFRNIEQVDKPSETLGDPKHNAKPSAPFVVPNSMILQFKPNASREEIDAYLEGSNLEVIQTFPSIGAVQVEADLTRYFKAQIGDTSGNQTLLRGLNAAVKDFQSDPLIQSAAPDLILRDQTEPAEEYQITNLLTASDVFVRGNDDTNESFDWGISDTEADKLWNLPNAHDGVLFGVMDTGFARHEDLIFLELPDKITADDHGNHVAAIGCGRHENEKGIRGVLPNCFVRARVGDVFFRSMEGGNVTRFYVLFSQILATLEEFVDKQDDIHTFNVSLGYNWRNNFGINPDLPESKEWRDLVAAQGAFMVSMLRAANARGKTIFSAAGNDSSGLATPINAKYASPFNWAAITAREQGITNGVVVEAHDQNGQRAPFSNTGGHISCPGVDVLSALAYAPGGEPSTAAYGKMSGTSMASPYCAAGHLLFRLVRPRYSGTEAVDCLLKSTARSSSGAPMLRLNQAVTACPESS